MQGNLSDSIIRFVAFERPLGKSLTKLESFGAEVTAKTITVFHAE